MQVIPEPCVEGPPAGAQIVQKRSKRSLSERILAGVTHVQEPILVPVDKEDQLQFRGREMGGDALMLLIDGAHEGSGWRQDLVNEDEDGLLRRKLDTFPDHVDELPHSEILWAPCVSQIHDNPHISTH